MKKHLFDGSHFKDRVIGILIQNWMKHSVIWFGVLYCVHPNDKQAGGEGG